MTLVPDLQLEHFAEAGEQYADELLTWETVKKMRQGITATKRKLGKKFGPDLDAVWPNEAKHDVLEALMAVTAKAPLDATMAWSHATLAFAATSRPDSDAGISAEEPQQVILARDILGNPFRPVAFDPDWRTSTALALAKQMYDSRDFSAMPILADALQDAGCENDDVLTHCRDANGVHVRGCWVVDLVLGKS
jgi:hypothetical protein